MAFSGALTLTDLNDFITPAQACIRPVEQVNAPENTAGSADTQIVIGTEGDYYEVSKSVEGPRPRNKLEAAQINLNDCLACSGCITSAESVLITLQSHSEVLSVLQSNPPANAQGHRVPVLSIAPQSLASLAASISSGSNDHVILHQVLARVRVFCTQILGFAAVYDTTFARHIALKEHECEFRERKTAGEGLPMLSSACPGWVCYAEKTHSEMLPFISKMKSPQQVMGTIVKHWMGAKWANYSPEQVYHVTVMPCYDKKLEASRQDFYNDLFKTRDVDCVITTGELELLMREHEWDMSRAIPWELESRISTSSSGIAHLEIPDLVGHPGTSSGSYLHSLIATIKKPGMELTSSVVRNTDYEEFVLTDTVTKTIVFKGAKCYGFRNLQNVVRRVGKQTGVTTTKGAAGRLASVGRRKAQPGATQQSDTERAYDYVEVMACPSGCVNGGGQLKARVQSSDPGRQTGGATPPDPAFRWGDKDWVQKVERAYWHDLPTPPPSPGPHGSHSRSNAADLLANRVLYDLCQPVSKPESAEWPDSMDEAAELERRKLFRTQYRAVESEVIGLAVKW